MKLKQKQRIFPLIIAILLFSSTVHAEQFYYFEITIDRKEDLKPKNLGKMLAGAMSSVFVHELGHIVHLESNSRDYEFKGFSVDNYDTISKGEMRKQARAGFLSQALVGLILTSTKYKQTYFTKGFLLMNDVELFSSGIRGSCMDWDNLDNADGNSNKEFLIYSIINAHNTLRIDW